MTTMKEKLAVAILLVINAFMAASVVHLSFFASKGPRYTADDGAKERKERIASDQALAARIDRIHALLEDKGH